MVQDECAEEEPTVSMCPRRGSYSSEANSERGRTRASRGGATAHHQPGKLYNTVMSMKSGLGLSKSKYHLIPWLQDWPATIERYERIATASARLGVGVLGQDLVSAAHESTC